MIFLFPLTHNLSQDGASALMVAASEGHTEVVTQLLEAGANTDLQSTVNYCTICVGVLLLIRVTLLYVTSQRHALHHT